MKRAADHEKFVGIMKSLARAQDLQNRDQMKEENKPRDEPTCFNCDKKKSCRKFSGKLIVNGTYSVGGDDLQYKACDKWVDKKDRVNDPKVIKNLLKQFSKKGLR